MASTATGGKAALKATPPVPKPVKSATHAGAVREVAAALAGAAVSSAASKVAASDSATPTQWYTVKVQLDAGEVLALDIAPWHVADGIGAVVWFVDAVSPFAGQVKAGDGIGGINGKPVFSNTFTSIRQAVITAAHADTPCTLHMFRPNQTCYLRQSLRVPSGASAGLQIAPGVSGSEGDRGAVVVAISEGSLAGGVALPGDVVVGVDGSPMSDASYDDIFKRMLANSRADPRAAGYLLVTLQRRLPLSTETRLPTPISNGSSKGEGEWMPTLPPGGIKGLAPPGTKLASDRSDLTPTLARAMALAGQRSDSAAGTPAGAPGSLAPLSPGPRDMAPPVTATTLLPTASLAAPPAPPQDSPASTPTSSPATGATAGKSYMLPAPPPPRAPKAGGEASVDNPPPSTAPAPGAATKSAPPHPSQIAKPPGFPGSPPNGPAAGLPPGGSFAVARPAPAALTASAASGSEAAPLHPPKVAKPPRFSTPRDDMAVATGASVPRLAPAPPPVSHEKAPPAPAPSTAAVATEATKTPPTAEPAPSPPTAKPVAPKATPPPPPPAANHLPVATPPKPAPTVKPPSPTSALFVTPVKSDGKADVGKPPHPSELPKPPGYQTPSSGRSSRRNSAPLMPSPLSKTADVHQQSERPGRRRGGAPEEFHTPADPVQLASLLQELELAKEALAVVKAGGGDTSFAVDFLRRVMADIDALRDKPVEEEGTMSPLKRRPAKVAGGEAKPLSRSQLRLVYDRYRGDASHLNRTAFMCLCEDAPGLITPVFPLSAARAAFDDVLYCTKVSKCDFDTFLGVLLQLARDRHTQAQRAPSGQRRVSAMLATDSEVLRVLLRDQLRHVYVALTLQQ